MPELPEVETIKRQLHERLHGRRILRIDILRTGRELPVGDKFRRKLEGEKITGVRRRAKLLIFDLDSGTAMICHLKMTGKFLFVDQMYSPQKHDRILFVFSALPLLTKEGVGEVRVMWSDVRQFGFVKIVTETELNKVISKYGPEPLETSIDLLADRLLLPKTRKIKAALLDQSTIAGVGNIYADEACFRAGIRPTRRLATLSDKDRLKLAEEIVNVLSESVAQKGTSANDYRDARGERGGFQALLKVYGRAGEPCVQCKTPIKKFFLAQRGTHYCPECQH